MNRNDKIQEVNETMLRKMFLISGHDFDIEALKQTPDWYDKFQWSRQDEEDFRFWAIDYVRNKLRCNKKKATDEVNCWLFNYGLKTHT